DDILVKADRAAMMNSLESRAVFLDNDLVAFCERLPATWKYRNGERKYLLKRALRGLVPDDVLARRKKGFGVPLAAWLRELPMPGRQAAGDARLAAAVAERWRRHRTGQADHRLLLWSWLSLEATLGGDAASAVARAA